MSNQPRVPSEENGPSGPDGPGTDDAVARLRAADPASDANPDLEALRSAVDERRAADGASSAGEAGERVPDELARVRARRWASWPARAAAVAAVALVVGGGGGYALGAAGDGDTPTALPAISLGGGGTDGTNRATEEASGDMAGGPAMAEQYAAQDGAGMDVMPYRSGRTVFTASGLSTEGGSGEAFAFDAPAAYTAEAVADAAAALGVEGEPREADWGWVVGQDDGTTATVSLSIDGTVGLSYWDPAKDPWGCAVVGTADAQPREDDDTSASSDVTVLPAPEECGERDLGEAPTGDAAVAQLRDAMTALGVDPGSFEYVPEEWGDPSTSYVTAHHVLDGRRTGLQWSASLTGAGIQSLNGFTAPLVALGEYDVVSPADAVERLSDPRFTTGWGGPVAWVDGKDPYAFVDGMEQGRAFTPTLPETVEPGAAVSWPVDQVTIVEARLGLAHHAAPDGASLLVPTYELIGDDGAIWTVVAVTEEHLDFAA